MNPGVVLTHAGLVDAEGYAGSGGQRGDWQQHELDPLAGKLRWKPLFGSSNQGFRRLDRSSKLFAIAAELCGLDQLPAPLRRDTALIMASSTGCLAADLRFEDSLHLDKGIEPAVFPYTLPSTVLGEIAIRHALRGPTLCLAVADGDERQGIDTGRAMIDSGEAGAALVLLGDWLPPRRAKQAQIAGKTRIVALLLQAQRPDTQSFLELAAASETPLNTLTQALRA